MRLWSLLIYELYPEVSEKVAKTSMANFVKEDNMDSHCSRFEIDKGHNMYNPQVSPLNSNSDWGSVKDHPLNV